MARPTDPCPLCGATDVTPHYDIAYHDIWNGISAIRGFTIDNEVVERNTPAEATSLVTCRACGLDYFLPVAPGDAGFYEALDDGAFYHEHRWDMDAVANSIPNGVAVLDVGCGGGAFLRMIGPRMARAVGLDHNRGAVAALVTEGFEATVGDLRDVAQQQPAAFDVITAMHVVEHLADVGPFIHDAVAALRPGGSLIIVVPNKDHFALDDFEPLDCPPHHVSRWGVEQFGALARMHGLDLCAVRLEPVGLATMTHIALRRTARRLVSRSSAERRAYSVGPLRRARLGLSMIGTFVTPTVSS